MVKPPMTTKMSTRFQSAGVEMAAHRQEFHELRQLGGFHAGTRALARRICYFCHASRPFCTISTRPDIFGPADIVEVSEHHACPIKINRGGRGNVGNAHYLFFRDTR
jgi:hypothetical protein